MTLSPPLILPLPTPYLHGYTAPRLIFHIFQLTHTQTFAAVYMGWDQVNIQSNLERGGRGKRLVKIESKHIMYLIQFV